MSKFRKITGLSYIDVTCPPGVLDFTECEMTADTAAAMVNQYQDIVGLMKFWLPYSGAMLLPSYDATDSLCLCDGFVVAAEFINALEEEHCR